MQLWILQTKLRNEDSSLPMIKAFQDLGLNWAAMPVVPFKHHIPDFDWDGPPVFYGSTGMVNRILENKEILAKSALFYDENTHKPEFYTPKYGKNALNHGFKLVEIDDLLHQEDLWEEEIFIRPNQGNKLFSGRCEYFKDLEKFLFNASNGWDKFDKTEKIFVNKKQHIRNEYRTWIVDGECVAIAQYRRSGKLVQDLVSDEVFRELAAFASARASECSPSPIFVLDIAKMYDDSLKVVEVNDFHCAGWYHPDVILDVVCEVSNYVAKHF